MKSNLLIFSFCLVLFVLFEKIFSCPMSWNYSLMLSFRSFVILPFTLRPTIFLIWFLCLVWGRVKTHFLKNMNIQLAQKGLWNNHPSCLYCTAVSLCHKPSNKICVACFPGFSFLFHWPVLSMCIQILHCLLVHWSFRISLDKCSYSRFFFFFWSFNFPNKL